MDKNEMDQRVGVYYEWGILALLGLLFGFVILSRLTVVYLIPYIIDEFKISYAQSGAITSILFITFAFSTWFFSAVSDKTALLLSAVAPLIGGFVALFYKETAPIKLMVKK